MSLIWEERVGCIANDDPGRPEMTVEEIAKELGATVDSVKHSLKRAIKKLRDGRAIRIKDLSVAREREIKYGLPVLPIEAEPFDLEKIVPKRAAARLKFKVKNDF